MQGYVSCYPYYEIFIVEEGYISTLYHMQVHVSIYPYFEIFVEGYSLHLISHAGTCFDLSILGDIHS